MSYTRDIEYKLIENISDSEEELELIENLSESEEESVESADTIVEPINTLAILRKLERQDQFTRVHENLKSIDLWEK